MTETLRRISLTLAAEIDPPDQRRIVRKGVLDLGQTGGMTGEGPIAFLELVLERDEPTVNLIVPATQLLEPLVLRLVPAGLRDESADPLAKLLELAHQIGFVLPLLDRQGPQAAGGEVVEHSPGQAGLPAPPGLPELPLSCQGQGQAQSGRLIRRVGAHGPLQTGRTSSITNPLRYLGRLHPVMNRFLHAVLII